MKQYFALGSYTEDILFGTGEVFHGKGKGISICEFEDGKIRVLSELEARNPSFLCIREDKRKIYAVNELKEFQGQYGGGITQVSYGSDGVMAAECQRPAMGADPCHVAVSPDCRFLSVANFADGSVTVFPLGGDGGICGDGELFRHQGSSVHPVRQKGPHAHSTVFAPGGGRMYVPDLGMDCIVAYACGSIETGEPGTYAAEMDMGAEGMALPVDTAEEGWEHCVRQDCAASVSVPAGSGPRYGEFDRDGRNFYLIYELASRVQRFAWEDGKLMPKEAVSTLPENFTGDNICSDLHITPDGAWLYASNRGHDSLACFRLGAGGEMSPAGIFPCGGRTPRNFAVDPEGRYLLVGNQDSGNITVFAIRGNGGLEEVSQYPSGSPVCIRFFREGL